MTKAAALVVGFLMCVSCTTTQEEARPVTEVEALETLDVMASVASERTADAMSQLCEMSVDECQGLSGSITAHPGGAPAVGDRPSVLCSRAVGDGAWMVVVEGLDGAGRVYASQVVVVREDDRVVPLREPAFWLGVGYSNEKVVGSTSWATAYAASGAPTDFGHTAEILGQARAACA